MHSIFTKPMLAVFVSVLIFSSTAMLATPASDLSGRTDDSIRQVLATVSNHQIQKLADGDYAMVSTLAQLKAARQPQGLLWQYPWGVTLRGMVEASDVLANKDGLKFVAEHNRIAARDYVFLEGTKPASEGEAKDWRAYVDNNSKVILRRLMRLDSLDTCGAMGAQMLDVLLRDRASVTPEQKVVLERIADYISNKQARMPGGVFWRPKETDFYKKWELGTVWVDDVYMSVSFLARWYQYTGDVRFLTDAARQIIGMAALLQDGDGVWFHAYNWTTKERSPVKWGRANGWVMVATVDVLSVMPADHPLREQLLEVFHKHVAGVKRLQAASGFWRQVLNEETLWEETSCTAMFGYSITRAVNRGWLPAEDMRIARRAFEAVCTRVTPAGEVNGTCIGTGIGLTLDFYEKRQRPDDDLHGRGPVLMAGAEILAGSGKK